ncbi:MAG: FAD-binding oxidoreductase [Thermoanaerobaculia bacterium]
MANFDLIIIGGGIIGGSTLYHLNELGYKGRVLVLEREDALSKGSTALSAGGFRNIWTTPINMRLTSYSIKKLKTFQDDLKFPIGFDQRGYLFCQTAENFENSKKFGQEWADNGVNIEFLDAAEVEKKVPGLKTGIDHVDPEVNEVLGMKPFAGGIFGPDCGSFDPSAAAQGYFQRAIEGFEGRAEVRLNADVKRLHIVDGKCLGVEMADGTIIEGGRVFVAAGAWTNQVFENSGLTGDDLPPVVPVKRMLFITNFPHIEGFEHIPFTIIDKGIYFKPEGPNLLIGCADPDAPPSFDVTPEPEYYQEMINYYLQERVPGMERCRLVSMWGGLYDINTADHNAILGFHPGYENLMFATGFSGHGAMEAPAAGLAMAELAMYGEYRSIDVSALSITRFKANKTIHEKIVI